MYQPCRTDCLSGGFDSLMITLLTCSDRKTAILTTTILMKLLIEASLYILATCREKIIKLTSIKFRNYKTHVYMLWNSRSRQAKGDAFMPWHFFRTCNNNLFPLAFGPYCQHPPVSHVSHPDFLPSVHLSATPLTCQAFYPTHSGQFQYFMIHFIRQIVF